MPAIGVWDAFDPVGATAIGAGPGLNGLATGETWLRVSSIGDDMVRIGIADQRGDGRPDYAYNGWVLYADTVQPAAPARLRRPHRHSWHGLSPRGYGAGRRPAGPGYQHFAQRNHRHRAARRNPALPALSMSR